VSEIERIHTTLKNVQKKQKMTSTNESEKNPKIAKSVGFRPEMQQ